MRLPIAVILAGLTIAASAAPPIPGAKVYIDDVNGFESDVSAAMSRERVPLVIVTDRAQAEYIVTGKTEMQFQPRTDHFRTASPSAHLFLSVTSTSDDSLAFYCSADKRYATHGMRDAAEKCAKRLREAMAGR